MATRAETLLVRIDGDLSKLRGELEKGERQTLTAGRRMTLALGGVERGALALTRGFSRLQGIVLGLAAGGFALLVRRSLEFAGQIEDTAGKIGISTTALQQLSFAAEQSAGVIGERFNAALQRFGVGVAEAAQGAGKLKDTLRQYNIAVTDGANALRPLEDVLGDVAEATRNAASGQEQLRIASKAFGDDGAALVNMLKLGRDGIQALRDEADRLGIPLEQNLIRKARDGERALAKLGDVIKANLNRALITVAPALERVAELIARLSPAARDFLETRIIPDDLLDVAGLERQLDRAQRALDEFQENAKTAFGRLKNTLMSDFDPSRPFSGAEDAERALRERILHLQVLMESARATADRGTVIDITAGPQQKIIDDLQKQTRAIEAETAAVGLSAAEKAKLVATERALEEARRLNLDVTPDVLTSIDAETAKIGAATSALENQQRSLRIVDSAALGLSDSFTLLANGAEDGSSRAQNALRALANTALSVLQDIQREIIKTALRSAIFGGGGGGGGLLGGLFSGLSALFGGGGGSLGTLSATVAKGGAFIGGRRLAFARGGIVSAPTVFAMAGGMGLMGEAGPEAVMPLRRGAGGRLGVEARGAGAGVTIVQNLTVQAGVAQTVRAEMFNLLPAFKRAAMDGVAQAKMDGVKGFAS